MMVKYDYIENCRIYRVPSGAVPDGTSVKIYIAFANAPYSCPKNIKNINLITIYNDSEIKLYKMNMNMSVNADATDTAENPADPAMEQEELVFSADIAVTKGLYFYYFEVEYQDKKDYYYKTEKLTYSDDNAKKWQITVYDKNYQTPDFFKGGIMYHIFVDRFARSKSWNPEVREGLYMHVSTDDTPFYKPDINGKIRNEDVYGGNIRGITEKLDYLSGLNVSIIYLCPIFEANSNHKYGAADYEKIDDMFGDDDIFGELIYEAGKRGMKIILDGVFNHTGDDSIYFNKYNKYDSLGAYQSKESKYYDWYNFNDWDRNKDDYECWWGVKSLPSLKKDQPVFRAYICGVNGIIEKWLKRGAAGYRIDVADELSDRMLKDIKKAAKETSPESIIIGEVWEDASNKVSYGKRRQYLLGNQLDSVMNYPLKQAIINYLRLGNSAAMSEVMDMIIENYPKQSADCLMNIIGTHDTMRILTALGAENYETEKDIMAESKLSVYERAHGTVLLKAAVLLQMTLPGIPCIYYGDEAGAEGYSDPFNRRFFPWDNIDSDIHEFYKKICGIRKSYEIFKDGEYQLVKEYKGLFFFKRVKESEKIYIYVNLAGNGYNIEDLSGLVKTIEVNRDFISLLDGTLVRTIKAHHFDIFVPI